MTSNKDNKSLTDIFNEYIEKSLDGKVKMSEFYTYVNQIEYHFYTYSQQIQINNKNLKNLFFDSLYFNPRSSFELINSNNLEIIIDETYTMDNFIMNNCKNIDLIFRLENNKNSFVNQNNFLFQKCKLKMIDIRTPSEDKDQFVLNHKLNFSDCEIGKIDRIKNKEFNSNLTFKNTIFTESVNFDGKIFNADIKFINCTFLKDMGFNKAVFEKEVEFQNCTFNKADFSSAIFKDNVYFNDSKFNKAFILYRAQFYKVADFFNLKFNDIYNFSSCAFKEPEFVSFIGFKTNINIETLENYIEKTNEEHKSMIVKRTEITWIENLKNSFAVIKHNFLQRDNLIEANKHKVLEFYAEELRLKYECGIKNKCCLIALFELMCAIFIHPRQTINYLQLLFYRHTSNHHTDLLKSFHTMLLLIGLFGLFTSAIILSFNCCYLDTFATSVHSNIELYNTHIKHYIIAHESRLIFINFGITFGFLFIFFILCIYFQNKISRFIVVSLSYLCSIFLLLFSPKSIISISNLFSGNQHILDPLSALSGIYTILFILLIYSLQKTSRRNSIM